MKTFNRYLECSNNTNLLITAARLVVESELTPAQVENIFNEQGWDQVKTGLGNAARGAWGMAKNGFNQLKNNFSNSPIGNAASYFQSQDQAHLPIRQVDQAIKFLSQAMASKLAANPWGTETPAKLLVPIIKELQRVKTMLQQGYDAKFGNNNGSQADWSKLNTSQPNSNQNDGSANPTPTP